MDPKALPLRDIHLPEPIGWWPPALGWWILALLVILTIGLCIWLIRRITRKTAIKSAKKLLKLSSNPPWRITLYYYAIF